MIEAVARLPIETQNILFRIAKPKFDSYFAFTSGGAPRSILVPGQAHFVYPNQTVIADLVFLWSVFTDVYEAAGKASPFAALVKSDPFLLAQIERIFEGGPADGSGSSFWKFPSGHVPLSEAIGGQLDGVLRTLRNGFAHSHWYYADVDATDYWNELGWDTTGADPRFNLTNRARDNYTIYIADAIPPWNPNGFWKHGDLRIVVTKVGPLRYGLHLLLNFILNGSKEDVFSY